MQVYSADLELTATIYVVANGPEDAKRLIQARIADGSIDTDTDVCGLDFDHPQLPKVSFSPAMTLTSKQEFGVEYVEHR